MVLNKDDKAEYAKELENSLGLVFVYRTVSNFYRIQKIQIDLIIYKFFIRLQKV